MRQKLNSTPFLVFLAIIIALYFSLKSSPNKYESELSSSELTLISGDKLELSQFKGQYYVIHIFASWCSICKYDFVFLSEIVKQTNAPVIGIAVNDNLSKLRLLNKANWPYNYIAIDLDLRIAKLIRNKAIPETIIIDPQGKVAFRYLGGLDMDIVKSRIIPIIRS